MTTPTEQAKALAKDIVRQWFSRSLGQMNGLEKWRPIWEEQLTEQFAAALIIAHEAGRAAGLKEAGKRTDKTAKEDIRDAVTERMWQERQGEDYGTY